MSVGIKSGGVYRGPVADINFVGGLEATTSGNANIATDGVTTARIANLAVTTVKIADLAVTTPKVADLNITASKIADGAVRAPKIALAVYPVTIASGATSGTATVAAGAVIIGFHPTGTLNQHVNNIAISGTTLTVTLAAAPTAANTLNVVCLLP